MVSGFLGTVISLERAVAINRPWAYVVPALAGLGALALLAGLPASIGGMAAVLAAAGLVCIFAVLTSGEPSAHLGVMTAGASCWLGGAIVWLAGGGVATSAWWWVGFLVLTIIGERMELNRVRRLPAWGSACIFGLAMLLVAGLVLAYFRPDPGVRLIGATMLGAAVWLLQFDVARRTLSSRGLSRFVSVCLLSGFVWLGVSGVLAFWHGPQVAGPLYDAQIHTVFVGFVLSMIIGHAPVVLPAVLMLPLRYRPISYLPLFVLHATLLVRVTGDLIGNPALQRWGGVGNVAAVVLFVLLSVFSASRRADRRSPD